MSNRTYTDDELIRRVWDVEEIKKVLKYPAQPQRVEGGEDVQMTPCTLDRYGSSVYVPEQHDVGARRWSEV